ncbi:hypothetical protein L0666_15985 [Octadecabacter sp. CECT 8868]|uniref:hypothetical protein n=1 Tax=Octadecabacter algicola TaxID=2909342 RepID=UPI001F1E16F9|nr:hypothetical protein [Octadecabacter algicola]MCF2906493.1 hypothetical protein [Octadecabacter algicola]
MTIFTARFGHNFRSFQSATLMAAAFFGLTACDLPDKALTAEEIAVAESQPPLNFGAEVDVATAACLNALENDQQSDISLAAFGYVLSSGSWEKEGPKVQLLATRSSVSVRFRPHETRQSVCGISIYGLDSGSNIRQIEPAHRELIARSAAASARLGFTSSQEQVGGRTREILVKDDARIIVQARQSNENGIVRLNITYYLDR